ncbi:MAG TPA: hypothetical protein DD490_31190 [Acidobacteria bacterium]|nr:hypothetical protein [Acidobacteriota bacterium]
MLESRLAGVPSFRGLGPECLALLERHLETKSFGSNEIVFRQGDACDGLYVVAEGSVIMRSETPGRPLERIRDLRRGDVFGEAAALLGTPRLFAARSVGETVLWKIPQWLLGELLEDPAFTAFLPRLLPRRRAARMHSFAAAWSRKEPRIWVDREVLLTLEHGERVPARLENLSAGGACLVEVSAGWRVRQPLGLALGIEEAPDLLRVRGIVRWKRGRSTGLAFAGDGPAHRRRVAAALRVLTQ